MKQFVHLHLHRTEHPAPPKKPRRRGRPPLFNEFQVREIVDSYNTHTAAELSVEYHCSQRLIRKILARHEIRKSRRKYTINLSYFEEINTPDKAYFLGLIASDGCVQKTLRGPMVLTIKLATKDEYILAKFLQCIGSDRHISRTRYLTQKRRIPREASYIIITSDKICEDLARYNITEKKTWCYNPVFLPDDLMPHFLRGYFDGDGTVYKIGRTGHPRPSDYRFAITSNKDTARFFHEYLEQRGIQSSVIEDKGPLFQLRVLGNPSKEKLIDLMYSKADRLYLTRKKAIADEFIACYRKRLGGKDE